MGGGGQTARKLIDDGWIGQPVAATAFFACHGPEGWHPNPASCTHLGGRPDARHRPVLHHGPGQPDGADQAGHRLDADHLPRADDHQPAALRHDDQGRGAHARLRRDGLRQRRDRLHHRRASTSGATPCRASRSTAPKARWSCPTRTRFDRPGPGQAGRRQGVEQHPATATATRSAGASAWPTWRTRSAAAASRVPARNWPTTCST